MPSNASELAREQVPVVGIAVPLFLESDGDCQVSQPVTVGIPFAKGTLLDPNSLQLDGPAGRVPLQTQALARWSDGSVQWLLLDFLANDLQIGTNAWSLSTSRNDEPPGVLDRLVVAEKPNALVIETGCAEFHLDRNRLQPFTRLRVNGKELLESGSVIFKNAQGAIETPRIDKVEVEVHGPVRATVRLAGQFLGGSKLRFLARLSFFAGTELVRFDLTIHNPRRARHPGGLWDLGDSGSVLFRDLSLELRSRLAGQSQTQWRAEPSAPPSRLATGSLEIYQDSSGGANWQSQNHVNREGRVPCTFRGYRVRAGSDESFGLRANPVVSIASAAGCVSAAIPEFWQQFPKAIEATNTSLILRLFPGQFNDLFELQGGEQKTHPVWLHFGPQPMPAVLDWVHEPARVHAAPQWYEASGAIPYLVQVSAADADPIDLMLSGALQGSDSFLAGRESVDEYGWRNFGDVYADHEILYYKGQPPIVSHYNNQYDVIYGTFVQYLRSGDARWFDLFAPLARHVIDIDIYHTDQDRAAFNGGMFWHTDHYRTAATSSHRAYSRINKPAGASYGGGPCNEHNYTTGLLHYFYLTGNIAARDAVVELANWVIRSDDGIATLLGVVDDGPTGVASRTTEPNYHGPGRGCGNSINALLDGWLVTGQRHYVNHAETLIRRCVHPNDDIAARDLLNVEYRWSYTVFLSVLARYLDIKAEQGEVDDRFAYAQASLLHYARWMLDHEEPYFAHPEKLEYPTETWAAQEFRKANVLRLAAAHADNPLRSRLLQRAEQLADRGWEDLQKCKPSVTARARAILFIEGMRDRYFRTRAVGTAPVPAGAFDFGRPGSFTSQRGRVLARLKSPRGFAEALLRLADPRKWWRFVRHPNQQNPVGGQP